MKSLLWLECRSRSRHRPRKSFEMEPDGGIVFQVVPESRDSSIFTPLLSPTAVQAILWVWPTTPVLINFGRDPKREYPGAAVQWTRSRYRLYRDREGENRLENRNLALAVANRSHAMRTAPRAWALETRSTIQKFVPESHQSSILTCPDTATEEPGHVLRGAGHSTNSHPRRVGSQLYLVLWWKSAARLIETAGNR